MYAYEIGKGLHDRYGFSAATVTTYVVLYKLRREGLIGIYEEVRVKGRPNRKYYAITDLARDSTGPKFRQDTLRLLE
jgi:DNA-binding PadR family transcriptional regulator